MDRINVILFGMTGFGNNGFKVLLSESFVNLIGIFTPNRINAAFPYFKCEHLQEVVKRNNVILYEGLQLKDLNTIKIIQTLKPDLIIVSNFNQIFPAEISLIPKLGVINIHPSLLPKYRGATPTFWVLMNGEKETGVTAHFIENDKIDSGRVISQDRLKIEESDNDGTLRHKLSKLSEKTLRDSLNLIMQGKNEFLSQNEGKATYFPKRPLNNFLVDINKPAQEIINKIRALTPYPGAVFNDKNKKYKVKHAELLNENKTYKRFKNKNEYINDNIIVHTSDGFLKLKIAKEL